MLEKQTQPPFVRQVIDELEQITFDHSFLVLEEMRRFSRGEVFVLRHLSEQEAPVLPTELSRVMSSSRGRISAILNALEKKGEIERRIDPNNRRSILVTLTDAGRAHAERLLSEHRQNLTLAIEQMGEQDAREFVRLAKKMVSEMQTAAESSKQYNKEQTT